MLSSVVTIMGIHNNKDDKRMYDKFDVHSESILTRDTVRIFLAQTGFQ